MSPKRAILLRCEEKIAGNHESMDAGLEVVKYNRMVGQNDAYADIADFVKELHDDDDDEIELEDLPEA
jgi:hypothetical protein